MLIWLSLMASCLCVEALLRRKPYAQSRLLLIAVFLAGMPWQTGPNAKRLFLSAKIAR